MADKLDAGLDLGIDRYFSKKVSKGVFWVTGATICARGLNLVSAIILARILAPEDFGLMAIAMAIITFSQQMTETGFQSALIQKQDRPEDFLNTAWTFDLAKYLFLFLIIFLTAPLFATFFKEPRAVAILRVISLSLVFQGLRNIGVVYFRKDLDFHKQFVFEIIPLIANICVVIPLAFILRNVWALVWATLASSFVTSLISYIMHPFRPHLEFEFRKAKELFNFGKWILGSSLVNITKVEGITMFVGRFLGMSELGFYNRAGAFSASIFTQVNEIVWRVGYPAYSQLQVDSERFKNAYLKTLQLLTFFGIPMAGGLFILSRDFVHLFLTDKWLPIVPLIQILCLQAILNFINTPAGIAFQASGRPSIGTKLSAFGVMVLIIFIYPLCSQWGITGVVASLFLSVLIPSPIIWYMVIKLMRGTFGEFFKPILISLINTGIMVFIILVIKERILTHVNIAEFFGLIFVGIITYLGFAYFLGRVMNYEVYKLIMQRIVVLR